MQISGNQRKHEEVKACGLDDAPMGARRLLVGHDDQGFQNRTGQTKDFALGRADAGGVFAASSLFTEHFVRRNKGIL